jgi:hypothetical protein
MAGVALLVAVLGTPATLAESADAFQNVFALSAAAFALSGVVALALARKPA